MAISTDIKDMFKAMNGSWSSRIFTLVLIALLTFSAINIFNARGRARCEDCTPYKEQNKQLIGALIDIKKDLQTTVTTSFNGLHPELIMFANFDSIPKRQNQQQQSQQIRKVMNKIDSILWKLHIDSLKKTKT